MGQILFFKIILDDGLCLIQQKLYVIGELNYLNNSSSDGSQLKKSPIADFKTKQTKLIS